MKKHSCVEWLLENHILFKLAPGEPDGNPLAYRIENTSPLLGKAQNIYYFVWTQDELDKMTEPDNG